MKLKTVVGLVLIVLSIGAMFFWEGFGRDKLTTESVLICTEDLEEGDIVSAEDLGAARVLRSNVLEGTLRPGEEDEIIGLAAGQELSSGQQLKSDYFKAKSEELGKGKSIFVIPSEWILSRSSVLRAGDEISIYSMPSRTLLGKYRIAFVKDASEQEVKALGDGDDVLERGDSGRIISGIEIICTLQDYFRIYDHVMTVRQEKQTPEEGEYLAYEEEDYNCLLLVMEGAV